MRGRQNSSGGGRFYLLSALPAAAMSEAPSTTPVGKDGDGGATATSQMETDGNEEGDNILDDILNTVDEKFDHDEDRRDYDEDEDNDDDEDDEGHFKNDERKEGDAHENDSEKGENGNDERKTKEGGGAPEGSDISEDEEELEAPGGQPNGSNNSATTADNKSKSMADSDLSEVSKKSSESESSDGEEEEKEKKEQHPGSEPAALKVTSFSILVSGSGIN